VPTTSHANLFAWVCIQVENQSNYKWGGGPRKPITLSKSVSGHSNHALMASHFANQ